MAAAQAEAGADAGVLKRRAQEAALEGLAVEAVVVAFAVRAGKPQRVQSAVAGDVLDGEDAARLAFTQRGGVDKHLVDEPQAVAFLHLTVEVDVGSEDFGDAAGNGRRDAGGIGGCEQGGVDPGRARDEAPLQHVVLDAGLPLAVLERQHQLLRRGLALAVVRQGIGQRLDAVLLVERGVDSAARREAQELARRGVTANELDERHVLLAELAQQTANRLAAGDGDLAVEGAGGGQRLGGKRHGFDDTGVRRRFLGQRRDRKGGQRGDGEGSAQGRGESFTGRIVHAWRGNRAARPPAVGEPGEELGCRLVASDRIFQKRRHARLIWLPFPTTLARATPGGCCTRRSPSLLRQVPCRRAGGRDRRVAARVSQKASNVREQAYEPRF